MNLLSNHKLTELHILKEEFLLMFPAYVYSAEVTTTGELVLGVYRKKIISLLEVLRDHMDFQFDILSDMTAIDYPQETKRFVVVYNLLSSRFATRIRLLVQTTETSPVASATHLFPAADWFEREIWDMFGIYFSNHPDLRRILTDYGFEGHPLRKDFPLSGFVEVRYDEEEKRVITEPLELTQEFRSFDFLSPWQPWYDGQTKQVQVQIQVQEEAQAPDLLDKNQLTLLQERFLKLIS
uniref:NADH dehydrogenase subunit 9 n=1 Tax=Jakoba libera TaxID=143017 RepID=M4Q9U9_JAKLI|nr:NADH dehydrogenase subunit 9 [Jakoba libera]AGH24187.1 NADH dehydrogenase subunit 9 [Jakoba libera]